MNEIIKIIVILLVYDGIKAVIYYQVRKRKWNRSELGRNLKAKMEDLKKVEEPLEA
jgi:hypothetical protein